MIGHRVAIALVGLLADAASAGDWPQFRGPNMAGIAYDRGLPDHWGPKEKVRWTATLPGRGVSSPIVVGDRIFLTACSGLNQTRLHVLCFNADTGAKVWERTIWATGPTTCNPKTCVAAPTPAADKEHVFALFATGDLICLDRAGKVRWLRPLQLEFPAMSNLVGRAASPVIHDDLLIVPMEGQGASFLFGMDVATGRSRWRVERPLENNYTTPLVVRREHRTDLVVQAQGSVTGYDPTSGEKRWEYAEVGISSIASPLSADGLILATGREMFALLPSDDGIPNVVWRSTRLSSGTATPLATGGRVYTVKDGGILACGNLRTGKEVWSLRLRGVYSASPVLADGKLYLVNEEGETTVVRTGDRPDMNVTTNMLGDTILATPAVSRGCLFLRSDGRLYGIGQPKAAK
jgi:outer membrane protein assembly factor BamB